MHSTFYHDHWSCKDKSLITELSKFKLTGHDQTMCQVKFMIFKTFLWKLNSLWSLNVMRTLRTEVRQNKNRPVCLQHRGNNSPRLHLTLFQSLLYFWKSQLLSCSFSCAASTHCLTLVSYFEGNIKCSNTPFLSERKSWRYICVDCSGEQWRLFQLILSWQKTQTNKSNVIKVKAANNRNKLHYRLVNEDNHQFTALIFSLCFHQKSDLIPATSLTYSFHNILHTFYWETEELR